MSDITFMAPPLSALAAPVLWEPNSESGERIVALVMVAPETNAESEIAPSVYLVFPPSRLKALLGPRWASARGILAHVQDFMNQQLLAGQSIDTVTAPFHGFRVGKSRRVRGYSSDQILDTAVRTVSAFGSSDGIFEEQQEDRLTTLTTSRFLYGVRSAFVRTDAERKSRFNKRLHGTLSQHEMVIDYAHQKNLVQVTSLPRTERQASLMQKEAESKLLELDITVNCIFAGSPAAPFLLINTQSLHGSPDQEVKKLATGLRDRIHFVANQKDVQVIEAASPVAAAELLEALG